MRLASSVYANHGNNQHITENPIDYGLILIGLRVAFEILERCGNTSFFKGNPGQGESHFQPGQGTGQHQVVEISQMTDAENFAFDLSKSNAQAHVILF